MADVGSVSAAPGPSVPQGQHGVGYSSAPPTAVHVPPLSINIPPPALSYTLKISGLAATDLACKPEAEISFSLSTVDKSGKARRLFKTAKKPASAAKWIESYELPIDPSVKSVKLTCWDKTKGKVFVGEANIPSSKFFDFISQDCSGTEMLLALGSRVKKAGESEPPAGTLNAHFSFITSSGHSTASVNSGSVSATFTAPTNAPPTTITTTPVGTGSTTEESAVGSTEKSRKQLSKHFRLSNSEILGFKEFPAVLTEESKSVPGTLYIGSSCVCFLPSSDKSRVVKQYEKQVFFRDVISVNKRNVGPSNPKSSHLELLTWDQKYCFDVFDTDTALAILNHGLAIYNAISVVKQKREKEASQSIADAPVPENILGVASASSGLKNRSFERSATYDSLANAQVGGAIVMSRSPSPKPARASPSQNETPPSSSTVVGTASTPATLSKPLPSPRGARPDSGLTPNASTKRALSGEMAADLVMKPPGPGRAFSLPPEKFQLNKQSTGLTSLDLEKARAVATSSGPVFLEDDDTGETTDRKKDRRKEEAERKKREKEEQAARIKEQKELQKKKGKKERLNYAGEVHLQIQLAPSKEGVLFVKVIECRNLDSKDSNGLSDPYVNIHFGSAKKKTKIVKKNLNPVFNEEFEFQLSDSPARELKVVVWDWDRMSADDHIGSVVIPLTHLEPGNVIDEWYTIIDEEKLKTWQQATGSLTSVLDEAPLSSRELAAGCSSTNLASRGAPTSTLNSTSMSSLTSVASLNSGSCLGQVAAQLPPTPQATLEAKSVLDLPPSKSTYYERLVARRLKARARVRLAVTQHTLPPEKMKRLEEKKANKGKPFDPDGRVTKTVLIMFILFVLLELFRRDM